MPGVGVDVLQDWEVLSEEEGLALVVGGGHGGRIVDGTFVGTFGFVGICWFWLG